MESTDAELRGRLLAAKLRGLIGDHLGRPVDADTVGLPLGAGMVVDAAAWVLVDADSDLVADRALGAALAWSVRQGVDELNLVADRSTGGLARRSRAFRVPIAVWFPEGRTLLPAVVETIAPHPEPSDEHLDFASMIVEGGADVNVEHGVVTGEVRGLEVCRVVDEATTGRLVELGDLDLASYVPESGVRLEVGVGANDREAFQIIHGDVPTVEALAGIVESVRRHRSVDAVQHPLNRMAPERFLRWQASQDPGRLGLRSVSAAPPPVPRPSMKDQAPAVAVGTDADGAEHLLIFTSGVDLDVVPFAVDAHEALRVWSPAREYGSIRIVGRSNDLVPITRDIAGLTMIPIELVHVDAA